MKFMQFLLTLAFITGIAIFCIILFMALVYIQGEVLGL